MPVKVTTGEPVYSLTSPPEQPEPYPPAELIAKVVEYDDRKIIVTVPVVDTIELIVDIINEMHGSPDTSYKSAKQINQS